MIFGNWRPLNIAGASLLFGLFKCIAAAYSSIDINDDGVYWLAEIGISSHLYRVLPYIITLLVLAFTSKKSRAPKAEGIPYDKGPQIRAAAACIFRRRQPVKNAPDQCGCHFLSAIGESSNLPHPAAYGNSQCRR